MILAGDVGGTKIRLALYSKDGQGLKRALVERCESRGVERFEDLLRQFLIKHGVKVETACFGVPGPVIEGKAKTTNLPWLLEQSIISRETGIPKVLLVNDLLATAAAVPKLGSEDLETLHAGIPHTEKSPAVVLAPGTGLGQAFLFYPNQEGGCFPLPSEGGHADFAPNSDLEIELLKHLMKRFGHVSYERVLCGSGLVNIYEFLKEMGFAPESASIAARMESEDQAAVISSEGLYTNDKLCSKALEMFCSILGAQAGNLALTLMATSGVYLGGGIPPKIIPKLREEHFLKAYLNKGRLSQVVKATPVHLIRDDHAAVLGAACLADEIQ